VPAIAGAERPVNPMSINETVARIETDFLVAFEVRLFVELNIV
jgi:hypothetical protein